jgi:hypothetical protein
MNKTSKATRVTLTSKRGYEEEFKRESLSDEWTWMHDGSTVSVLTINNWLRDAQRNNRQWSVS